MLHYIHTPVESAYMPATKTLPLMLLLSALLHSAIPLQRA
jgi:hypothetical protein